MKDFPRNKTAFDRWSERLRKPSIVHSIPAMLLLECRCLVVAYYGSWPRACWEIAKHCFVMDCHGWYWSAVYRLGDLVGWTVLRPMPDVPGAFIRHSAKCDKLNCDDIDCVKNGIPLWFRKLSGMTRHE